MEGFWSGLGTVASVDWCEPNYAVSPWVAEWWNTVSSTVITGAGVVGWWRYRQHPVGSAARFRWGFLAIAIIGLGSIAFHATLLKVAQATDELPMIYASLLFAYILRFRRDDDPRAQRRWQVGLGLYAAAFTATYAAWPELFVPFIATYAIVVAGICTRTLHLAFGRQGSPTLRRLFGVSVGAYVGGLLAFWIPEHLILGCAHPLQQAQLHALFHLTSSAGTYAWLLFAMTDRGADPRAVAGAEATA
jgi:dihydroceramidase